MSHQVFIKASWHVGEPHLSHYTRWFLAHAKGSSNTGLSCVTHLHVACSPRPMWLCRACSCWHGAWLRLVILAC